MHLFHKWKKTLEENRKFKVTILLKWSFNETHTVIKEKCEICGKERAWKIDQYGQKRKWNPNLL